MNRTTYNTTSTALLTIQNGPNWALPACIQIHQNWVKINSEVEMWPTRTTNYYVCNDRRKTKCDYRQRPKLRTFLEN